MKTQPPFGRPGIAALLLLGAVATASAVNVYVDPGQAWIGYMNVFELPANGSAYDFGGSWGTGDLDARFSGSTLTLTPNDNIDRTDPLDTYWWQPPNDGSLASVGNHTMDASMYVQNDALAGQTVTFSGNVWNNSLVAPYTSTVFIKDFAPDYSSSTSATAPLVQGRLPSPWPPRRATIFNTALKPSGQTRGPRPCPVWATWSFRATRRPRGPSLVR